MTGTRQACTADTRVTCGFAHACFCSQVVFQEAQLGHLRFFEPAGQAVAQTVLGDSSDQKFALGHTRCQVQLYHLRMQEFLAAEALRGDRARERYCHCYSR